MKKIVWTVITILITGFLMFVSGEYIPRIGGSASEGAIIIWGCLGAVVIPLVLAFLGAFMINRIFEKKQSRLLLTIIVAVICAVLGCIFESLNLIETLNYMGQIDFNDAMSIMQMASFQPRYTLLVKILILIPALARIVITMVPNRD